MVTTQDSDSDDDDKPLSSRLTASGAAAVACRGAASTEPIVLSSAEDDDVRPLSSRARPAATPPPAAGAPLRAASTGAHVVISLTDDEDSSGEGGGDGDGGGDGGDGGHGGGDGDDGDSEEDNRPLSALAAAFSRAGGGASPFVPADSSRSAAAATHAQEPNVAPAASAGTAAGAIDDRLQLARAAKLLLQLEDSLPFERCKTFFEQGIRKWRNQVRGVTCAKDVGKAARDLRLGIKDDEDGERFFVDGWECKGSSFKGVQQPAAPPHPPLHHQAKPTPHPTPHPHSHTPTPPHPHTPHPTPCTDWYKRVSKVEDEREVQRLLYELAAACMPPVELDDPGSARGVLKPPAAKASPRVPRSLTPPPASFVRFVPAKEPKRAASLTPPASRVDEGGGATEAPPSAPPVTSWHEASAVEVQLTAAERQQQQVREWPVGVCTAAAPSA